MNDSFKQTILNAYQQNSLSHAYLLAGNNLDSSIYFLLTCFLGKINDFDLIENLKNNNIPSVIWLDGFENSIKKQDVLTVINHISLSGQKICVLKNVDQASNAALNSLLKAIEEPENHKVKFLLTTTNKENVLATIVSRCQVFNIEDEDEIVYQKETIEIANEILEFIFSNQTYNALAKLNGLVQYDSELLIEIFDYLILKINRQLYQTPSFNLSNWYINLVQTKQDFKVNLSTNLLLANLACKILEVLK